MAERSSGNQPPSTPRLGVVRGRAVRTVGLVAAIVAGVVGAITDQAGAAPIVSGGCLPLGAQATDAGRDVTVANEFAVDQVGPVGNQVDVFGHRVASLPTPGVAGPIVVIGDSLTHQSAVDVAVALRDAGWGPICVDGTGGRSIMFAEPANHIDSGLEAIARIKASDPRWASPDVKFVVALGTNDIARSKASVTTAEFYVQAALDAVGTVTQPVAFVTVRTARDGTVTDHERAWNTALTSRKVEIVAFDTAAAANPTWLWNIDKVHLSPAGISGRATVIANGLSITTRRPPGGKATLNRKTTKADLKRSAS